MTADEFDFLGSRIQNYITEAAADLIPVPGQVELHAKVDADMVSCCLHAFVLSRSVADLIVGMEALELHCRCRGRSNVRKKKIE